MGYVCRIANGSLHVARLESELEPVYISIPVFLYLLDRILDPELEKSCCACILVLITSSMTSGKLCNFSELSFLISEMGLFNNTSFIK